MIKTILETVTGTPVGVIGTTGVFAGERMIAPAKNSTPEAAQLHAFLREIADAGCRYAVMEVSSHALDIGRVFGIKFETAVFTNLAQDHLDYHKTMEAYLEAKSKLFKMTENAVINADDPAAQYIISRAAARRILTFALHGGAELYAGNIRYGGVGGTEFEVVGGGEVRQTAISTPGGFMVMNALAAIGAAVTLGIPFAAAADAVKLSRPPQGRMQQIDAGQDFRVIVDYAHTPESIRQITAAARAFTPGRLICLFGCGGDRDRTKRPLMGAAASEVSDLVIVTTDNPRSERPGDIISEILPGIPADRESLVVPDRREAIGRALAAARRGDTVLLLGKGHETYQEINGVRLHFDDREEAERFLKRGGEID